MKKYTVCLTVVFLCSISIAVPIQWKVEDGGNGHWYEAVSFSNDVTTDEIDLAIASMNPYAVADNGIGWWESGVIAHSRGGFLASIQSQDENDFIFDLVNNPVYWDGGTGPWFGGLQDIDADDYIEPDGAWIWSNKSVHPSVPFSSITFEPMSYSNWYGLEPNNEGGYENVTHFCTEGASLIPSPYWNDKPSNSPCNSFVVEYEVVPEPCSLLLIGCGCLFLRETRK